MTSGQLQQLNDLGKALLASDKRLEEAKAACADARREECDATNENNDLKKKLKALIYAAGLEVKP